MRFAARKEGRIGRREGRKERRKGGVGGKDGVGERKFLGRISIPFTKINPKEPSGALI